MAKSDDSPIVADAGPLIHLADLRSLDLLAGLGKILVPTVVWEETTRYQRISISDIPNAVIAESVAAPTTRLLTLASSLELGPGEIAAIALMGNVSATLLLCDDAAARLAAESLGYSVRGTIGLIVRAVRARLRSREQVVDLLHGLPHTCSLHISRAILDRAIAEVLGE